ncbi:MFS transporter [Streptomyces sp. Ru73]|uniref:MFS transporter n=1 Tax=Streptomyces sp. Ru73 TaxID=2080748 RepID=UPI000CDCFFA8|nr:MFS transporter [Streptomyces sp. Ru73]POX38720.1 MFS transporter [Streptomyces sp. Ru73]
MTCRTGAVPAAHDPPLHPVPAATAASVPAAQRRILTVLVLSQVLSGAGLAAGITVGALLAEEMLGTGLAGLPSALFTAGSALGAVAIGRLSQRWGRRPGLALGYAGGALGSLGVVAAAAAGSAPLLFVSLTVYGAGTATNLMARYAGADLAAPERRGRAVSTVLMATTLGAVAGPLLVSATGEAAHAWGLPRLAGPFALAAVAFAAAALLLSTLLRPDPLRLARTLAADGAAATPRGGEARTREAEGKAGQDSEKTVRDSGEAPAGAGDRPDRRGLLTGTSVMVLGQLVMIAIMTMTPVHMRAHGHDTGDAGLVIALHVGAMFLPSPLTGQLVDRVGRLPVAAASGVTLCAAGAVAALAPVDSVPALAAALVLLGLGWNFGLISGTALVTDALPAAVRARQQGVLDVGIALAGATGGLSSGLVVTAGGFPVLALVGGVLALAILPALALTARRTGRAA